MGGCLRLTEPLNLPNDSYDIYPRRKIKSMSESSSEMSMRFTPRLSMTKKQIMSSNFDHNAFLRNSNLHKSKSLKPKDKLCGNIVTSQATKSSFRHAILKYKKNYHPTNASRGSRDTSN